MIYEVTVKTNSKKGPLIETNSDGSLTVYLRAKPHDGEANAALISLLAKHFKTPKTAIKIISGTRSHHKKIAL